MSNPKLEDVFKLSGMPTFTFVQPPEYNKLVVSLRTPGRGVVIEGPSGIGKTTAVTRALRDLRADVRAQVLHSRKAEDREVIRHLPEISHAGIVVIDDFHRLEVSIRKRIADFLKTLADEERADIKLIVVGINNAGESLFTFARDLVARLDVIAFEANPEGLVRELVEKGERALRVRFAARDSIVKAATGSFFITQLLCHQACLEANVMEAPAAPQTSIPIGYDRIVSRVMETLTRHFGDLAMKFAAGPTLRPAGRAPYLHLLRWLAEATEWSISLEHEMAAHPGQRGSVRQIIEKGSLQRFMSQHQDFGKVLHYDPSSQRLTAEDPQFVFYLRNLLWAKFAQRIGYLNYAPLRQYDFALSFAGSDRRWAKKLAQLLTRREFQVFYDRDEQHRILAQDLETYLAPIYRSEAEYVICLLGPDYPARIWTHFESQQFRSRFGDGSVVPIWFKTAPPGAFDESTRVGGIVFDPAVGADRQLLRVAELLAKKVREKAAERARARECGKGRSAIRGGRVGKRATTATRSKSAGSLRRQTAARGLRGRQRPH